MGAYGVPISPGRNRACPPQAQTYDPLGDNRMLMTTQPARRRLPPAQPLDAAATAELLLADLNLDEVEAIAPAPGVADAPFARPDAAKRKADDEDDLADDDEETDDEVADDEEDEDDDEDEDEEDDDEEEEEEDDEFGDDDEEEDDDYDDDDDDDDDFDDDE